MAVLDANFYNRDTVTVAWELLGKYLVRELDGSSMVCRITETEAYVGPVDKACHAYGYLRTKRTETLFAPPGRAYIYLIYGMYHCLNFVTEPEGEPCAVLIRGGQARYGTEQMARLRFGKGLEELTPYQRKNFLNGPGKLCKALALTRGENGLPLDRPPLWVCSSLADLGLPPDQEEKIPLSIQVGKRIGIDYAQEAVDFPWRFYL